MITSEMNLTEHHYYFFSIVALPGNIFLGIYKSGVSRMEREGLCVARSSQFPSLVGGFYDTGIVFAEHVGNRTQHKVNEIWKTASEKYPEYFI